MENKDIVRKVLSAVLGNDELLTSILADNTKKRTLETSPIKLKRFKTTQPNSEKSSNVRDENTDHGARASPRGRNRLGVNNETGNDLNIPSTSNAYTNEDDNEDDLDDLLNLECMADGRCDSPSTIEETHLAGEKCHTPQSLEDNSDDEIGVLGGSSKPNWEPSEKVFSWFKDIADLELKSDVLKELKEKYEGNSETQSHFEPPRFPESIWNTISSRSQGDTLRSRSIYKAQDTLCTALKPLLTCLETASKETRSHLGPAIQLITTANLQLSRFRRVAVSPYLKKELRKKF